MLDAQKRVVNKNVFSKDPPQEVKDLFLEKCYSSVESYDAIKRGHGRVLVREISLED